MKILGIEMYPRSQTDADYIEAVRRTLGRSKWIAVQHGAMAILFIGIYCAFHWMSLRLASFTEQMSGTNGTGMGIGIILGVMQGLVIVFAVSSIGSLITVLKGQRTERLMIRFHDELQRERSDCQPPSGAYR